MRTPTLRRGTAQRCTAGVVMLMLAAGTVGLAVASDDEPAEAEASPAAIDSLPTGPTASPSASSSPSSEDDAQEGRADGERTERPSPSPPATRTPEAPSGTTSSPAPRRASAAPSPTGAAPTVERPTQSAPAPSPSPTREPRERGALGDLLAGLLGQD